MTKETAVETGTRRILDQEHTRGIGRGALIGGMHHPSARHDINVSEAAASGQDVWYIGYVKDMAIEFILDCAQWAEHFSSVAEAIEVSEEVWLEGEEKKSVFAFSIKFASGNRITALSSKPRNLRGKQGRVILDEAAFHEAQTRVGRARPDAQVQPSGLHRFNGESIEAPQRGGPVAAFHQFGNLFFKCLGFHGTCRRRSAKRQQHRSERQGPDGSHHHKRLVAKDAPLSTLSEHYFP